MSVYRKDSSGKLTKIAGSLIQHVNNVMLPTTHSVEDGADYYDVTSEAEKYIMSFADYTNYSFYLDESNTTGNVYFRFKEQTLKLEMLDGTAISAGQLSGKFDAFTLDASSANKLLMKLAESGSGGQVIYDLVITNQEEFDAWVTSLKEGTCTAHSVLIVGDGGTTTYSFGTRGGLPELPDSLYTIRGENGAQIKFDLNDSYYFQYSTEKDSPLYSISNLKIIVTRRTGYDYIFRNCCNISNVSISVENYWTAGSSGVSNSVYGFYNCTNITNCYIYQAIRSDGLTNTSSLNFFTRCKNIINCTISSYKSNTYSNYGTDKIFNSCSNIIGCNITQSHSGKGSARTETSYTYYQCDRIVNCSVSGSLQSPYQTYYNCTNVVKGDGVTREEVELLAPQEVLMGADGVEESEVYVFEVQDVDSFIDYRTNKTRFLLDLSLPVVGALSLDKPVAITFGDTSYYLYNILKGNEKVTIRDLKQVDRYDNATGYRFIFHATFFENDDITGFVIIPTISMSDVLSLTAGEMDAYMMDGGLTAGQLAICNDVGTYNAYELGAVYQFAIIYPDTYSWTKLSDTSIELDVPNTATQGTLTAAQLAILQASDSNGIVFDHEYYRLSANGRNSEGYRTYYNVERENGETSIKTITVTESTLGWVLFDLDVEQKATDETYTITTDEWTELADSSPYAYAALVTATYSIGTKTEVGTINDQPILFANYGFVVGAINGQLITIYAIDKPAADTTLSIRFRG